MPKIKYAIEKGGPERLEISWKGSWKEFTIRLDGNEVGSISDLEQLREGQEFCLEDGSCLKVQLARRTIFPYLHILRDGRPLPSLGPEPAKRLSIAYKFIFLMAGVNLVTGLAGVLFHTSLPNLPPASLGSVVIGCLFLLLGFFIMRRSIIALVIAMGIIALDLVFAVIFRQDLPRFFLIAAVIFRIFILLAIAQGFGAIHALKHSQS